MAPRPRPATSRSCTAAAPGDIAAYADNQRLRQVMVNLASNAVKYNHHGGMIKIGYRLDGRRPGRTGGHRYRTRG